MAPIQWTELAASPVPAATRLAYGAGPQQFGDLRLPPGRGPFPVVLLVHGGCWRAQYGLDPYGQMAAALTRRGVATWTIEYRRLGDTGGGWPGTFDDVSAAADHLARLATRYPLDLRRVVAVGHSAGGQLALWLAARGQRPPNGGATPLRVHGVVGLAAVSDLATYGAARGGCNAAVPLLLGGTPDAEPARYAAASPIALVPLHVPTRLVHGTADPIVPVEQSRAFAARARAAGDDATATLIDGAGHFDLMAPQRPAVWSQVERIVLSMIPKAGR
jgi:acetyl esterase/lipase